MSTNNLPKVKVTIPEVLELIKEHEVKTPNGFVGVKMKTLYDDVLKKCKTDGTINPYYKGIYKVSNKTYRLVTDYELRVRKNLEREGKNPNDFVVEPPKGKRHISKSLLTDTQTGTKFYLNIEWFPEIKGTTEYLFNDEPIEKELFQKWISQSVSSNQKQGLDREVKPITPNFENIIELSIGGVRYEIVK